MHPLNRCTTAIVRHEIGSYSTWLHGKMALPVLTLSSSWHEWAVESWSQVSLTAANTLPLLAFQTAQQAYSPQQIPPYVCCIS